MTKSTKVSHTVDWELWRDPKGVYELHDLMTGESITIEPYDDSDQVMLLMGSLQKDMDNLEMLEENNEI